MSLSVTSAPDTLALLQALSRQVPSQPAAGAGRTSATDQTSTTAAPSVSASTSFPNPPSVADGVAQALTSADAADAAGQSVIGLLQQLRAAAGQAADPLTSADDRAALNQQFQASAAQIAPTLAGATVNGANLVDGSLSSGLKVALGGGATASLTPVDLSLGGSTLSLPADASLATSDGAAAAFTSLGGAIGSASAGLSTLQTQADQISAHAGFVQTLGHALASSDQGGGDSARLLVLQVSQQLSAQPASIANQSPQAILSLFRS